MSSLQRFAFIRACAFQICNGPSHNILVGCLLDTNQYELLSPWEPWSAGWGGLQASWNHNKQVNWATHSLTKTSVQNYFQPHPPFSQKYKIPKNPDNHHRVLQSIWASHLRGDLPIYVVGSGSKAIIWNYDIFGFDSGRTKQLCDIVADAGSLTFQLKIHPHLFLLLVRGVG